MIPKKVAMDESGLGRGRRRRGKSRLFSTISNISCLLFRPGILVFEDQ
jgi:hypothetical protein